MLLSEAISVMVAASCRTLSRRSRIAAMSSPCREALRQRQTPTARSWSKPTPPWLLRRRAKNAAMT